LNNINPYNNERDPVYRGNEIGFVPKKATVWKILLPLLAPLPESKVLELVPRGSRQPPMNFAMASQDNGLCLGTPNPDCNKNWENKIEENNYPMLVLL